MLYSGTWRWPPRTPRRNTTMADQAGKLLRSRWYGNGLVRLSTPDDHGDVGVMSQSECTCAETSARSAAARSGCNSASIPARSPAAAQITSWASGEVSAPEHAMQHE